MKAIGFFSTEDFTLPKSNKKKQNILSKDQNANYPVGENACNQCKLYKQEGINSPKLKPYGKFRKKILVIGESPSENDDNNGKPFSLQSQSGKILHETFKKVGLNLYRDCKIINACDCAPLTKEGTREPTEKEIRCCLYRTELVVKKYKPKYILLLGTKAKKSFYSYDSQRKKYASLPMESLRGLCVPDKNSNAFIYHSYHPRYIISGKKDSVKIFYFDILNFANIVRKNKKLKFIDFTKNGKVLTSFKKVKKLFAHIKKEKPCIVFDYETSSYRYHELIHEPYLVSIHPRNGNITYTVPLDFPKDDKPFWNSKKREKIFSAFKDILEDENIPKIAQNIKHEIKCSWYLLNAKVRNVFHDTMIASHIINPNDDITGLKKQAYINFGQYNYGIADNIMNAEPKQLNLFKTLPFDVATKYCSIDSKIASKLTDIQLPILHSRRLMKANKLLLEGVQAFADIERNGIKINVKLAKRLDGAWGERIEELKNDILSCKEARKFNKIKGRPLKYEKKLSDDDLRILLFDILKLKPLKQGKTKASVDVETLTQYINKSELVSKEMECRKLDKMKNTYLAQFLKLEVNGFIYPTFNLHTARSFRSSSTSPNFQNIPKRSEMASEIRQIIISRWGNEGVLAEVDYGSMEVRIIACITKDPALIDYIVNGGDMHGDWAEILFRIRKNEINSDAFKKLRYIAKNHWVFPLFYGSWYRSVARATDVFALFKEVDLPCPFKSYSQWEEHLKKGEAKFWKQFNGVRTWQDKYNEYYNKHGFIKDFSWGFEAGGYLSRNQIYNFPIQGPAYHCLQYTINNLWRNNFYNFVSLLCGQIHDALFWDNLKSEFNKVRKKVHYLMTDKIREDNPWIIVPLVDEWSKGPNWADMEDCNWEKITKE